MRSLSRIVHGREDSSWQEIPYPDLTLKTEEKPVVKMKTEEERIREKSEKMFRESVEKAQTVLNQARVEALKIKKAAYEEGYVDGMEKGCEDGRKKAYEEHKEELKEECRDLQKKIEAYVLEMEHAKERVTEEYLDDLKNIALAIGEKIIQTSLKSSGDVVKNMILAATDKLKKTAWAKIYISDDPEEKAVDIRGDAELMRELSRISDNVKIIVMEDAAPGTCIVELPQEVMDISVGTQMENIKEILNNARV